MERLGRNNPLFRNPSGHFRAGWRILIYLGIVLIVAAPLMGVLWVIGRIFVLSGGGEITSVANLLFFLFLNGALVLGAWITLRRVDRRPFLLLGLLFRKQSVSQFLLGFAIGFLNMALVFVALWISGSIQVTLNSPGWPVFLTLGQYLVAYGLAAAMEELLNRGYVFQALCEGTRV
jgi:hypothetical protein